MSLLKILYLITFKITLFSNLAYSQNIDIVVATVDKEKIYLDLLLAKMFFITNLYLQIMIRNKQAN